ncbi:MAG TPA: DUF6458 family protein [Dermatophilaceae bacterium]|nr:DUF6458 family protein [Dermatophilaceae bacterium]
MGEGRYAGSLPARIYPRMAAARVTVSHRGGDSAARDERGQAMSMGVSLLLIAVGAILKFAVTGDVSGIKLGTVGVILMIIGAAGLVLSLVLMSTRRRTDVIHTPNRTTYVEPNDRIDP